MEVWITRQEEKHRRYLPGILLESVLIFLVNGVGTFALFHTLIPSVNGIPFLMSVAVTALLCGFLLGLREHLVAAVFSLSAASGICLTVFFRCALKWIPFTLEPACRCSWEKSRDLPYHLPDKGIWECKWRAGSSYFPWHCMWVAWLLNSEASAVCAAPSFCSSTSGGSDKNRLASRYQALSWLLRRNPVRIKLYDQKQRGKIRYRF